MSDDERKADRGAFFKSVHSTLNHLLFADRVWMSRFTGKAYEFGGMGVDIYDGFSDLRHAHRDMAADIEAWTQTLTPEWLSGTLRWTNIAGTVTNEQPNWLRLKTRTRMAAGFPSLQSPDPSSRSDHDTARPDRAGYRRDRPALLARVPVLNGSQHNYWCNKISTMFVAKLGSAAS